MRSKKEVKYKVLQGNYKVKYKGNAMNGKWGSQKQLHYSE